jgi:hypothetical protein
MKAFKKKRSRKSGVMTGSIQRKPVNDPFFQSDGNEHNFFVRQAKTALQHDRLPAELKRTYYKRCCVCQVKTEKTENWLSRHF